ncbi:MAG: universal stress protein [Deltaproteobacteria bacterium]|nr:universal stress protein [Deltaproteobacteria bacterium]MBW2660630.1 universal stress protein [Deltaproteobacteria bacterium]
MKMLIALDDSEYAIKVVNYVASAASPAFFNITLFTVLPIMSSGLEKEFALPHFSEKLVELKWMISEKKKSAKEIMEKCRDILLDAGFSDDKIELKIQDKVAGIARDIIAEVRKEDYDTLVVGRRGLSAAAAFVFGSVSNKIVQTIKNRTLWIV